MSSPEVLRFRDKVRRGEWRQSTVSMCPDRVQSNLVILPQENALDFTLFCLRNPKPCPIQEVLDPGDPEVRLMASDADIRTDLPQYRIFEKGHLVREADNILDVWRSDLVTFLIGCSYTFEKVLVNAGVPLKNHLQNQDPGVYVSTIQCRPAGFFSGPMLLSMRPVPAHLVPKAVQVTSRFPKAHGAPVHIGDGAPIGVFDYAEIAYGSVPEMDDGDVPVFWGCGITPQKVALDSKIPFMITHKPCHMFISDRHVEELAEF